MKHTRILFILIMSLAATFVFAQIKAVNFRDGSYGPRTQAVLNIECQALFGQDYTFTFPTTGNKWRYQWYKDGGDGIISPLDEFGNPTGDDVVSVGSVGESGNTQGVVSLGPNQCWNPSAATFQPTYAPYPKNTIMGNRIYLRIFNAPTIAAATKSIAFTALYTITAANNQLISPYIPTYAWGPWEPIQPIDPPADPQNVTITPSGQDINLTWDAVTETVNHSPIVPSGYILAYSEDGISFYYLGNTTSLSYTHSIQYLNRIQNYRITAYVTNSRAQSNYINNLELRKDKIPLDEIIDSLK